MKWGVFMNGKKHDNNAMTTYTEEVAYCACTPKHIGVIRRVRRKYDAKNNVETQYIREKIICKDCQKNFRIEYCTEIFEGCVQSQKACLVSHNSKGATKTQGANIYPLTFFIKKDLKQYEVQTDLISKPQNDKS